jgi:glycerol-3-phosphate cytidylyltransferase
MKNHILYTGGTFDLFHSGHVNLLKQCRSVVGSTGKVIVSLNTDEFIFSYKQQAPIQRYDERRDVLLGCKYVDEVVANVGGSDSKQSIMQVNPTIIAIGSDWARKDYYKQMSFTQDWLDSLNIMLLYIPYTSNISTTEIKKRLTKT